MPLRFGRRAARSLLVVMAFGGLLAAGAPAARDQAYGSGETSAQLLPAITIKDSRLTDPLTPLGRNTAAIERSSITQQVPASAAQLLQGAGGAYLDQTVGPGGFASMYLRGADPSATLILVDGVRINDATNSRGGAFDFGLLDPATIERIEVVPGALSAVYGPDAIAGVVNIFTRSPQGPSTGGRGRVGAGGSGYRTGVIEGQTATSRLQTSLGGAITRDGPWDNSSRSRLASIWARGGASLDGTTVSGSLRATTRKAQAFPEDSGGIDLAVRRVLDVRESDGMLASLVALHDVASAQVKGYVTASRSRESSDSPGVAPGIRDPFGIPPNRSDTDYRRYAFGATASGEGRRSAAGIGIELQYESGRSLSELWFGAERIAGEYSRSRSTRSVFADGRLEPMSGTTVRGVVRADWITGHGLRPSMSLSSSTVIPDSVTSFRMMVGTGFKPPSFYALSNPIVGNPKLLPETSTTAEVGFTASAPSSPITYSGGVFVNRYGNLVDFEAGPPPRLVNRAKVVIAGLDASAEYRAKGWSMGGAATILEFTLPDGQIALRNRPRAQARLFAGAPLTSGLSLTGTLFWQDEIYDSSIPTGPRFLPAVTWLDMAVTYRLEKGSLRIAVDNTFDRHYQQTIGVPALSSRIRADVELTF